MKDVTQYALQHYHKQKGILQDSKCLDITCLIFLLELYFYLVNIFIYLCICFIQIIPY